MNTLYININGDDIKGTENMTVVGKPEDAIINKFYFELVKGIVKGVTVPGIGEVKKKSLVTDFAANNAKAFAKITEQWDLVKQALLGENPDVTFTVTLPQEYVEWLYNHTNPAYNRVAESLASRGNAVGINVGNIYRNGLLLLVNVIDTKKEYDQFVVSDALVDDESAIAVAIRKRIGEDVPFVAFMDFEVPENGDTSGSISGGQKHEKIEEPEQKTEDKPEDKQEQCSDFVFKIKNMPFVMKHVEGGSFMMGAQCDDDEDDNYDPKAEESEHPVHEVTLGDYFIGETLVTQALWEAVMNNNPSCFRGGNLPVENVSWNDCQEFIRKLNHKTGKNFRLPTEGEWEYAARGGRLSEGHRYSGSDNIDDVAWYCGNSCDRTHPVKEKLANELGIFDMSGNVWEWCSNCEDYSGSTDKFSVYCAAYYRAARGGSWNWRRECPHRQSTSQVHKPWGNTRAQELLEYTSRNNPTMYNFARGISEYKPTPKELAFLSYIYRVSNRSREKPDFKNCCLGFRLCLSK